MKNLFTKFSLLFILVIATTTLRAQTHNLAVLDFQNNTGKESLNYLSQGIPQMLVTELSAIGSIKVVERQRMQEALKELELGQSGMVGGESARRVGEMLGAELMIMGSYIQIGTRFRIDAHLVQVSTGEVIGEKISGSGVNDVMRMITELSGQISNRILTPEEAENSQTTQTGSIAITSNPAKAQVFLDGLSVGVTPISLKGVLATTHDLALFTDGYNVTNQKIKVKPEAIEVLNINLEPITDDNGATFAVSTKPVGVLVVLDGLPVGNTPLTFSRISSGEHTIRLEKNDFNSWEFKKDLPAGKITAVSVNLSPYGELGSMVVNANPSGVRVFLNGFLMGATPITLQQLAVGEYELKLVLKDYEEDVRKVKVVKDEVVSISTEMEYASEEGKARKRMLTSQLKQLEYMVFGVTGKKWGELYEPSSVAVDEEGQIFVADWLNHRVQKFASNSEFIGNIGVQRNDFNSTDAGIVANQGLKYQPGTYYKPEDIALGPNGEIYICDSLNNQIQKFSKDNEFLIRWGRKESTMVGFKTGRLQEPRGVCVDHEGNVYVADYRHQRIQKFSDKGYHLLTIGGKKSENRKQFKYPIDIAVDPKLNIWVVDEGTNQVLKFDQDKKLLLTIGKAKAKRSERSMLGNFYSPNGIAIDLLGNVYVADSKNHRVQIFDNNGNLTGYLGKEGSKRKKSHLEGEFNYPMGVAVDIAGNIYVADRKNDRIHRFPPGMIKKP